MVRTVKKMLACLLAVMLCLCLFGCAEESKNTPDPTGMTQNDDPILPGVTNPGSNAVAATPVYASTFGDTVFLSTVPLKERGDEEPDCEPREISNGGRISCNGEHEEEVPITKVVIMEDICPKVCSGWFRDMVMLESITGLEKLHMEAVTDTSYMFAGCERLTALDTSAWDVSNVKDMTGMFDGCIGLDTLPQWYQS